MVAPGLPPGRYRIEIKGGRIHSLAPIAPDVSMPRSEDSTSLDASATEVLRDDEILIPAFVDAHTHLLGVGTSRLKPNLHDSFSREEAFARLAAWLSSHPGDDPVIAEGWDQSGWADPTFPTRDEIDRITARPVALRRVCGHIAVLNSAALARVGTGWDQVDFETGLALEALPLRLNRVWPRSTEMLDQAFEIAQEEAFRCGVAAIQEMGDPASYRTYGRAEAAGKLMLRVSHFFQLDALESVIGSGMVAGMGSEFLRVGGIKLFLDGSIGGRTAALFEPYATPRGTSGSGEIEAAPARARSSEALSRENAPREPGSRQSGALPRETASEANGAGALLFSDEDLARQLQRCSEQDLPVALHAIGDRAIDQAVRILERLRRDGFALAAPGPRIEHAELLPESLRSRAVAAGAFLSMQPNFTAQWQGEGGLYERMLGPARARALNPYRDAYRSGRLLFGSDTMPLGPIRGLRGACCHPDPEQRLSLLEAIEAYTAGSAQGVRRPFGSARVAVGEPADLVALQISDGEPDVTVERIADPAMMGAAADGLLNHTRVSRTWVNGRSVYRSSPSSTYGTSRHRLSPYGSSSGASSPDRPPSSSDRSSSGGGSRS